MEVWRSQGAATGGKGLVGEYHAGIDSPRLKPEAVGHVFFLGSTPPINYGIVII
jgi:hypothetical protein